MKRTIALAILLFPVCAFAGNNQWTTNGPFGGRVEHFTFHPSNPDLVFAGAQGGLFRSKNGGASWQRLSFDCENAPIIRIHPKEPGRILIRGNGIFQSLDEGKTFERLFAGFFGSEDMEFHPTNPDILYLVDEGLGGFFKSTDSGITWVKKNKGLKIPATNRCCGHAQIEVSATNGDLIYLLFSNGKFFKTINGGESWTAKQNGIRISRPNDLGALAIDPHNDQVLYLGGAELFKTTNGANSWVVACDFCFSRAEGIAIDPKNPVNIYSSFHKSRDAGATWTPLKFPIPCIDFQGLGVHPRTPSIVLAGGSFTGGIFRSNNFGETWQLVNRGVDAERVDQIVASSERPGFFMSRTGDFLLQESRNGGRTWTINRATECMNLRQIAIHRSNPNLFLATGFSGGNTAPSFGLSRDGGKTWQVTRPFPAATGLESDPLDDHIIYIAPFSSNDPNIHPGLGVAKSTDQGETWKLITSGLTDKNVTVIRIHPQNRNLVFVGTESGKIFRSANAGGKWINSSKGLDEGVIQAIGLDSKDQKIIYAATFTQGAVPTSGFFKSTDGGRKWISKTNGMTTSGLAFRFITVDQKNPKIIYSGGSGGFFISTNGAESWSTFDSRGLGQFAVLDFLINPAKADSFFIGTERGVFSFTRTSGSTNPDAPVIAQVSPSFGKVGDSVNIVGRNFGQTQGDSKITFAGADVSVYQSWSDTGSTVEVPSGARIGSVTTTVGGRKSNPFEFIVLPSSGNLEPAAGPSKGGTRIAILDTVGVAGTQFNILFGANLASETQFISPNIILCTAPAGTGTVEVSIATTVITSVVGTFTYQ